MTALRMLMTSVDKLTASRLLASQHEMLPAQVVGQPTAHAGHSVPAEQRDGPRQGPAPHVQQREEAHDRGSISWFVQRAGQVALQLSSHTSAEVRCSPGGLHGGFFTQDKHGLT